MFIFFFIKKHGNSTYIQFALLLLLGTFILNFFNPNLVAAHAIYVSETDIEILKKNDVSISYCPNRNAKSGRKIAPVYDYLNHSVNVTLGTDGPMSGNHLDLIGVMNLAPKLQKVKYQDRSICEAKEILKMATINGETALRIDDLVGSIEVGKKADLVMVDSNDVNSFPFYNPISHLIYSASGKDVSMTMIDGKIVYQNGNFPTIDIEKVKRAAERYQNKME